MHPIFTAPQHKEDVDAFVLQIFRTGLMLTGLAGDLIETLPDDTFPGEDPAHAVIDCIAGSVYPLVETAGVEAVRSATALLDETGERVIAHLRLAVELKQRGEA